MTKVGISDKKHLVFARRVCKDCWISGLTSWNDFNYLCIGLELKINLSLSTKRKTKNECII